MHPCWHRVVQTGDKSQSCSLVVSPGWLAFRFLEVEEPGERCMVSAQEEPLPIEVWTEVAETQDGMICSLCFPSLNSTVLSTTLLVSIMKGRSKSE